MHLASRTVRWFFVGLAICPCLVGCAAKVPINGKLTLGGQPLQVPKRVKEISIIFVPEKNKEGKTYNASFTNVGVFHVPAVPAGKYRVVVRMFDTKGKDILGEAYELDSTKIIVDVDGKHEITIDIPADELK